MAETEDWSWLGVSRVGDRHDDRWSTQVDWADDAFLDRDDAQQAEKIEADAAAVRLEARVLEPHGPGGGWPVVELVGSRADLTAFLADHHDDPRIADLVAEQLEGREAEELTFDDAEAAGTWGNGLDGDPRFPHRWSTLTGEERTRLRRARGMRHPVRSDFDSEDDYQAAEQASRRDAYLTEIGVDPSDPMVAEAQARLTTNVLLPLVDDGDDV